MGIFTNGGVGIDFGSANTTICLENEGVVLREPSFALTLRDDFDEVLAVGRDARQMLGRTPKDVILHSPIADGAVANTDLCSALMRSLSDKALGKRRALEKNRIVVSASQGLTRVEYDALIETIRTSGVKKGFVMRIPVAAAIGAGIDIDADQGCMLISIGGSTTDVSVLSTNGIVAARTMRTGSLAIDEAVIRYIRRKKGLIIGQRTAEDLKIDLGSVRDASTLSADEASLRGRDARTGKPSSVAVNAKEVNEAILPEVERLIEMIREAFENTPAEMAEDILKRGIFLTGGGAQLDGLTERLSNMLNIPITLTDHPQDDVALGCCYAASDDRLAQRFLRTGCLIEL